MVKLLTPQNKINLNLTDELKHQLLGVSPEVPFLTPKSKQFIHHRNEVITKDSLYHFVESP